MVQSYSEITYALSLLDQRLDKLKHVSIFISADEYRNIYSQTHNWNNRIPYLRKTVFNPEKIDMDKLERNKFPLKLFSTVPNHAIYDSVAAIPVEFQYVSTKDKDLIILRVDLADTRYMVTAMEMNEKVLSTIQVLYENILEANPKMDKSSVFEHAYYEYIHKNSIYILSKHKSIYNNWNQFAEAFYAKYQTEIKEYSSTGRYLWHRDYILLDNRAMKDYKVYTLKTQWQDNNKEDLESIEPLEKIEETPTKYFDLSALFMDDKGNYWSSKDAYLRYCKFLDT